MKEGLISFSNALKYEPLSFSYSALPGRRIADSLRAAVNAVMIWASDMLSMVYSTTDGLVF